MSEPGEKPPPEGRDLELPKDLDPIPVGGAGPAAEHLSFNQAWRLFELPETPANARLRELFYEWLGQRGYDVHDRDEPTIIGDAAAWRETWRRYQRLRRLS